MPPEEAMEKYIEIVTQLYPTWLDGGVVQSLFSPFFIFVLLPLNCSCAFYLLAYQKAGSGSKDEAVSNTGGTMGPVFSSLVYEEESENEL